MDVAHSSGYKVYGNNIHHVATNLPPNTVTALYHGFYLSEQNDHFDFGWNTIAYVQGCRGFQQYINEHDDAFDVRIHDNIVHDTQCDGILMVEVDPAKGPSEVYNNIIYNTGLGPNNAEGSGSWTCLRLAGGHSNTGKPPGVGFIEVYNNTMYNCGTFANPPYGDSNAAFMWTEGDNNDVRARLRNNIFYMAGNRPYFHVYGKGGTCSSNCPQIIGSNNLFFGSGTPAKNATLTNSLNKDPGFVNVLQKDFHLTAASPAKQAGADLGATSDFDGNPRGNGTAYSIGAHQ